MSLKVFSFQIQLQAYVSLIFWQNMKRFDFSSTITLDYILYKPAYISFKKHFGVLVKLWIYLRLFLDFSKRTIQSFVPKLNAHQTVMWWQLLRRQCCLFTNAYKSFIPKSGETHDWGPTGVSLDLSPSFDLLTPELCFLTVGMWTERQLQHISASTLFAPFFAEIQIFI